MTFTKLGLLGPAGSGKDLLADFLDEHNGFRKISFADPIKRFAKKTFGFTEDQLWGPSKLRNQTIDISLEWWMNAVGNMGSAFDEILNHVLQESYRSSGFIKLMEWFSELRRTYPEQISARLVLQTLGTEWGRSVEPLLWARYAHQQAEKFKQPNVVYNKTEYDISPLPERYLPENTNMRPCNGVVIPDHRFINEVALTQELGGYVIRLRRLALENTSVGIAGHRSEAEQNALFDDAFDLVLEIDEFKDLEELRVQFGRIVQEKLWTNGKGTKVKLSPHSL